MNEKEAEIVVQGLNDVCGKHGGKCEWDSYNNQFVLKKWMPSMVHVRLHFARRVVFSIYAFDKKAQLVNELKAYMKDGDRIGDLVVGYDRKLRNKDGSSRNVGVVVRFVSPVAPRDFLHSLDVISEQAGILLKKLCETQKKIMF